MPPADSPKPSLADFTSPALLVPTLRASDSEGVIRELSALFGGDGGGLDAALVCKSALDRERMMPTVVEFGAFPHARLSGSAPLSFALGRPAKPLRWGETGPTVKLVILHAVSASAMMPYLRVLSAWAKLMQNGKTIAALLGAASVEEMLAVLRQCPASAR